MSNNDLDERVNSYVIGPNSSIQIEWADELFTFNYTLTRASTRGLVEMGSISDGVLSKYGDGTSLITVSINATHDKVTITNTIGVTIIMHIS